MSTTVQSILDRMSVDLQEDSLFSSGIWTATEIIGYINYAEIDFIRRTGILKTEKTVTRDAIPIYLAEFFGNAQFVARSTTPPIDTACVFPKPSGVMDIERISYEKRRLYRQTLWDLQRENPNWRNQPRGRPRYYHEDGLPKNSFEVDRLPATVGNFRLFCDVMPTTLVSVNDYLNVPDSWVQYIAWEVLSLALSRDGDGQDIARAQYAHARYLFGVNLALRLVRGEMEKPVEVLGAK